MRVALQEAEEAYVQGEVPVGAVAVYEGVIIARGHNRLESWQDPTAHAEILVLREAAAFRGGWRLNGVTLYVTLEPCPMCAGAIVQARISRLVYGAPDPRAGAVDSVLNLVDNPRFNHRVEVIAGVLEDECRGILKKFFAELRRDG
ncbi:MAG: tRNA(adenine34) deaminase [Clostridia bacterium]|nr:tRNA(adenine34) deaminase [Clostridia bacterium]